MNILEKTSEMKQLIAKVKKSAVVRNLIPMELGTALPLLSIRNNQLCVTLPFFRAMTQPEDKTLLYPFVYTITAAWPNGNIIEFKNLRFEKAYKNVEFSKPVGTFRHEAIKHLNKARYKEMKDELFLLYDELIINICSNEPENEALEMDLKALLALLVEPSLKPFYEATDKKFYHKFME